jgi:hypothetical protein
LGTSLLLRRPDLVVGDLGDAVGLRPDADLTGDCRRKGVVEVVVVK